MVVNDGYGEGVEKEFSSSYSGEILETVNFEDDSSSFRSELQSINDENPDVVIVIGYSQSGSSLMRQAYETGIYEEHEWLVSEAVLNPEYLTEIGTNDNGEYIMEGLRGVETQKDSVGPGHSKLHTRYEERFGEEIPDTPFFTESYDAYAVLALAMERSDSLTGPEVQENIRPVTESPGVEVKSISEGLEALQDGEEINYQGASSEITFDEGGSDTSTEFAEVRFVNGEKEYTPLD